MALRYWSGNATPTSFNWNYNSGGITNWGSASGVADNVLPPTAADDVIFDGAGIKGNANSIISANITILSLTFTSGYTGVVTINNPIELSIAGNFTDNTAHTWTILNPNPTLNITATSTITSNGSAYPGGVRFLNANTKTLVGDWTINFLNIAFNTTINATTNEILTITNGVLLNFSAINFGTASIRVTGGSISFGGGTNPGIGNLILDGNVTFGLNPSTTRVRGFIRYVSGTITGANVLNLQTNESAIFDVGALTFNSLTLSPGTYSLNSKLTITGTTTTPTGLVVIDGTDGRLETGTLALNNSLTLKSGVECKINTALICVVFITILVSSSSPTVRAILTLANGAVCNAKLNFTRIDASGGRAIDTWNGVVTDCVNVRSYNDLRTVATAIIN